MTTLIALVCVLLGLIVGYYARTMRDIVDVVTQDARARRAQAVAAKKDESGVIVQRQFHKRGETVQLPHYDPSSSSIVRARTPEQVKKDSDKEWNDVIQEYRG